jgi:hypothetical protein
VRVPLQQLMRDMAVCECNRDNSCRKMVPRRNVLDAEWSESGDDGGLEALTDDWAMQGCG